MAWLPHEAAGLTFIGLEMGEVAKFLPQVRTGAILPGRSLFYVPPITLALMLVLLSSRWPNERWQTWALRALALAISLLAFPAFEAIGAEAAEWLWRLLMIALVFVVTLVLSVARRPGRTAWSLLAATALAGAVLPTWVYLAVRDAFDALLPQPVGIGPGVWLNLAGHLLAFAAAVAEMRTGRTS